MSEPSDWEPLPDDLLSLHPGERREPAAAPGAPARAPSRKAPAPAPAVPDPAAERALAALKARLAQAPPAKSLVAEVQHREQREARKRAAANAPFAAAVAPLQSSLRGPQDLPLPVEFDAGVHGLDPREEEPWFRALPAAERERLHAAWAGKREQVVDGSVIRRRNQNRRLASAVAVFGALVVLGTGTAWPATLGAGVACGIWWRHVPPDRFRDPVLALGCFLALQLVAFVASRADTPPSGLFMDAILLVAFAAIVGFDGEMRRTGGFDAK